MCSTLCGGLDDVKVSAWNGSMLEQKRTQAEHIDGVVSLLFVGGQHVTCSDESRTRVWNIGAVKACWMATQRLQC